MKDYFLSSKKIIKSHLSLHWKLLLFFIVSWFLLVTCFCIFYRTANGRKFIAESSFEFIYTEPGKAERYPRNHLGFGMLVSMFIVELIGIPIFTTFSIAFVFLVISYEIKSGRLIHWMVSSFSKANIILSKIFFIIIALLMIYAPGFIITFFTFISFPDWKEYIWNFISISVSFIGFIFILTCVFILITLLLSSRGYIDLIISSLLLIYILATGLMKVMNETTDSMFPFIQYISPSSIVYNSLCFKSATGKEVGKEIIPNVVTDDGIATLVINFYGAPHSRLWIILSPILNIIIFIIGLVPITYIFNRKDLNI